MQREEATSSRLPTSPLTEIVGGSSRRTVVFIVERRWSTGGRVRGLGKSQLLVDEIPQGPSLAIPPQIVAEKIGHRIDPVF